MKPFGAKRWIIGLVVAWIACTTAAFAAVTRYEAGAGPMGEAPARWPNVGLSRSASRFTLVMLAHPRCPCTRASLRALERILSDANGAIDAHVLVADYDGVDPHEGPIWDAAQAIPGVTVRADRGEIARIFGAETSGYVVLYDADGRLRFRGGITPARAHEGDSPGRDAILGALAGKTPDVASLVFGCALSTHTIDSTLPGPR